ncbi:MAG: hypothetical protein J5993_00830 [Clostridia bacterium]|nr:hypothetical protein [Clostridia bacterium]
MRVCLVNEGKLLGLEGKLKEEFEILVISPIGRVSYTNEIEGRSGRFRHVARLSSDFQCIVLCGCTTEAKGIVRKSVLVADRGKLVGISDMTHSVDHAYNAGGALRLYETALGKIGVLVGEDLFFPETMKLFSDSGADVVFSIVNAMRGVERNVLCTYSFCYGIPVCFVADRYSMISSVDGTIAFSTANSPEYYALELKNEYHLVETRQKGFFRE